MTASTTIAIVTGSNRGIGLAICQKLASTFPKQLLIYALSRAGTDLGLQPSSKDIQIRYAKLSLTNGPSISALAKKIKEEHGGCDVLINNAGVYYYREDITPSQRMETFDVNYRGTLRMCQEFMPILRDGGRIVNVSSQSGLLKYYKPGIAKRFRAPYITLEDVEQLVQEYNQAAANGTATKDGWPAMTYFISKAALNAVTRILARENPKLLINCCCPGWVNTDLGSQAGHPPKTVEEGAMIPFRLGFKHINGVSGKYWSSESVYDTGEGSVQDW